MKRFVMMVLIVCAQILNAAGQERPVAPFMGCLMQFGGGATALADALRRNPHVVSMLTAAQELAAEIVDGEAAVDAAEVTAADDRDDDDTADAAERGEDAGDNNGAKDVSQATPEGLQHVLQRLAALEKENAALKGQLDAIRKRAQSNQDVRAALNQGS